MIQESETCFGNMLMSAFRIPIMYKSLGRYSKMGSTMGLEKGSKG